MAPHVPERERVSLLRILPGRRMPCNLPPAGGNFSRILEAAAATAPDRPAIVMDGSTHSFAELHGRAGAYANALGCSGIAAGARVGILMERGFEAAAAYFGTLAFGAVPIIINDALRRRQVAYALEKTSAEVVIASAGTAALGRLGADRRVPILVSRSVPPASATVGVSREIDHLAQIIFTSGSTGLPKGVMLSHGNLLEGVRAVTGYLGLDSHDRTLSLLPLSSVFGLNQLICAVASRSTLVIERSPLPSRIWETVRQERVTVLAAVPPLWHQLLASTPEMQATSTLRILQNAGGHLPESAVRSIRRAIPDAALFLMYGMTEVIRSTYLPPAEVDRRPGSIGIPVPGARVVVERKDGSECDPEEVGELVHIGPTTALGYWNDARATAQLFLKPDESPAGNAARGFRSGDLVKRDEDGFLYYVGRRDRMIKSMGYRVGPDDIVEALHASGEVTQAVVSSEPTSSGEVAIVAYIVLTTDGSLDRLGDYCRREMPRYMQPRRIEVLRSIPMLPGGKYDLSTLSERTSRGPRQSDLLAKLTA